MKVRQPAPQYLVDDGGNKEFVVLTIKQYEDLLEDLRDLAVMAERRDEPGKDFDEFKKGLKKDGLI